MTLQEAKELQQQLQKHNPFARIPAEQANKIILNETQKEVLSKEP